MIDIFKRERIKETLTSSHIIIPQSILIMIFCSLRSIVESPILSSYYLVSSKTRTTTILLFYAGYPITGIGTDRRSFIKNTRKQNNSIWTFMSLTTDTKRKFILRSVWFNPNNLYHLTY